MAGPRCRGPAVQNHAEFPQKTQNKYVDRSQEVMMVFIMDYFSIIHFKDPANGYFSLLINLITKSLKQLVENRENCFHPTTSKISGHRGGKEPVNIYVILSIIRIVDSCTWSLQFSKIFSSQWQQTGSKCFHKSISLSLISQIDPRNDANLAAYFE